VRLRALIAVLMASLCTSTAAADLELVFRHGEPIEDYEKGWKGHVERASWIDDDRIVYQSRRAISCISMKTRRIEWVIEDIGEYAKWTVSRDTKRLALLDKYKLKVVDCSNGKPIFSASDEQITKILGVDSATPSRIAFSPIGGRLILYSFSTYYGRNGFVLDPSFKRVHSTFDVDAAPSELTVSDDGKRIAVIADEEVLCVHDLATHRDVFFEGTRIQVEPKNMTHVVDAPFYSHFRDSGGDLLVYTRDNSWATGKVSVRDLRNDKVASFDARNGHIELDVLFEAKRIALTGTSTDLTILDFKGNEIAHKKKATLQRNMSVEFSPSGKQLLVGSWDGAIYVYALHETPK
jgi:WD40 repeat protein